ncbi:Uncharacterised protein [Mycobacteroides abscessus subsp. abscessus]|nr:Uncharacterised protein [Mycobacteroides abscessus subsp. abscessus]SHV98752.1 Uncharacterised protein [Mycobacteroides abscessus subsp. abscessus]SKU50259.1 Uncharacterised protein [Mycobacteroides abscessus subsp. abscessus]SKV22476.1 Uncharacterised protein [Mycobacteroides abscessus subsp. abscessus]
MAACAVCAAADTSMGWRGLIGMTDTPTVTSGTVCPTTAAMVIES